MGNFLDARLVLRNALEVLAFCCPKMLGSRPKARTLANGLGPRPGPRGTKNQAGPWLGAEVLRTGTNVRFAKTNALPRRSTFGPLAGDHALRLRPQGQHAFKSELGHAKDKVPLLYKEAFRSG